VCRYEQTLEHQRKVLEIEPDHVVAHAFLGQCYALMGRYEEALAELQMATMISGQDLIVLPTIGYVYALAGQRAQARAVLARLRANWQGRYASAYDVAKIYLALGAHERALRWLGQSFADRDGDLIFLNVDPSFAQLRAHPRFVSLLRRLGFTDLHREIAANS
jgi:tetratricopeptide (TPR) repeat protein